MHCSGVILTKVKKETDPNVAKYSHNDVKLVASNTSLVHLLHVALDVAGVGFVITVQLGVVVDVLVGHLKLGKADSIVFGKHVFH